MDDHRVGVRPQSLGAHSLDSGGGAWSINVRTVPSSPVPGHRDRSWSRGPKGWRGEQVRVQRFLVDRLLAEG